MQVFIGISDYLGKHMEISDFAAFGLRQIKWEKYIGQERTQIHQTFG